MAPAAIVTNVFFMFLNLFAKVHQKMEMAKGKGEKVQEWRDWHRGRIAPMGESAKKVADA